MPTHPLSTLYRKVPDSRRSKPKPKPKLPARPAPAEYYDDYYYDEPVKRQGYGGEYIRYRQDSSNNMEGRTGLRGTSQTFINNERYCCSHHQNE